MKGKMGKDKKKIVLDSVVFKVVACEQISCDDVHRGKCGYLNKNYQIKNIC